VEAVERTQQEHVAVVKAAEQAAADAESRLAEVRAEADSGLRRLLTAQGDDLVAAVAQSFESLGFKVRDMDEEWPKGDKREDLRVQDPARGRWEAVIEVRGYTKGAQQGDLLRISRFVTRYLKDEQRLPTRPGTSSTSSLPKTLYPVLRCSPPIRKRSRSSEKVNHREPSSTRSDSSSSAARWNAGR
jgi:hypothetical protein